MSSNPAALDSVYKEIWSLKRQVAKLQKRRSDRWWNFGEDEDLSIPFEDGWNNLGPPYSPTAFHRAADGEVRLRGVVDGGGEGTNIGTLPLGFRPEYDEVFIVPCVGGGRAEIIIRAATGKIFVNKLFPAGA